MLREVKGLVTNKRKAAAVGGVLVVLLLFVERDSPLALPAGMVEQSEGAALFRQLAESLSDHPAGKTLYRALDNPAACTLDRLSHSPNPAAAALLTPPARIPEWKPPPSTDALRALHTARAQKLLAPWLASGVERKHMVVGDANDRTQCEEPVVLKYIAGQLYANLPTWETSFIAGFDSSKVSFMNPRRKHTVDAVRASIRRSVAVGIHIDDFEIVACHGDGFLPTADTIALGLAWGGEGTGTLPVSEQEWNWQGHDAWGDELTQTFKNREGSKWESRKNTAVFRGGINDRACYPITELGGDEVGAVDSAFAHKPCGRKRLLQVAKCFPTALDAAPTDHKQNFMTPQDQESYKYVLYAEGNYGWANRLKTLLAMGNAVLMQQNSGAKEWYSLDLKPWVHYIPVDHLFNAVPEVVAWAATHDDMVKQITANADAYARHILEPSSFRLHLDTLLLEYSKLVKFPVELDPLYDIPADVLLDGSLAKWVKYLAVAEKVF